MTEKYRIDGTNISSFLTHLQFVDGGIAVPPVLQTDYVVPGRTGVIAATPAIGPRPLTIGGVISAASRFQYQTTLRAFAELVFNAGKPFTLTRVLDIAEDEWILPNPREGQQFSFGPALTHTSEAQARYVSGLEAVEELSDRAARVAVTLSLLEGFFYDDSEFDSQKITSSSFSLTNRSNATTHKVRVIFNDSASTQRLTNVSTDDWVEYSAQTTTQAVTLDSEKFTATQGDSNRIEYVSANTTSYYWMRLRPGVNRFTLSGGGSVRLLFKGAWL